ncbi:MAG: hypothetical protein E3J56_00885 [Candidatus Aminicenantes bacterium]|nr:MAG: hypothetical protein E3J56_00885 [Candidatus Aminicenantes bacterium]
MNKERTLRKIQKLLDEMETYRKELDDLHPEHPHIKAMLRNVKYRLTLNISMLVSVRNGINIFGMEKDHRWSIRTAYYGFHAEKEIVKIYIISEEAEEEASGHRKQMFLQKMKGEKGYKEYEAEIHERAKKYKWLPRNWGSLLKHRRYFALARKSRIAGSKVLEESKRYMAQLLKEKEEMKAN